MKLYSIIGFSHEMILKYAHKRAKIIDATLGNGNDLFFIKNNFPLSKVYGFDVQELAIKNSKEKNKEFKNIEYILDSHENFDKYISKNNIDLIIYNLGYLPNSDSKITTKYDSTIKSIESGLNLLKKKGAIILTIYTNHDENNEEKELIQYISKLSTLEYDIIEYKFINKKTAPYNIVIEKR